MPSIALPPSLITPPHPAPRYRRLMHWCHQAYHCPHPVSPQFPHRRKQCHLRGWPHHSLSPRRHFRGWSLLRQHPRPLHLYYLPLGQPRCHLPRVAPTTPRTRPSPATPVADVAKPPARAQHQRPYRPSRSSRTTHVIALHDAASYPEPTLSPHSSTSQPMPTMWPFAQPSAMILRHLTRIPPMPPLLLQTTTTRPLSNQQYPPHHRTQHMQSWTQPLVPPSPTANCETVRMAPSGCKAQPMKSEGWPKVYCHI